ncbi:MAG: TRAP transporter small permease subunit [Parvularculaceae bacterium]
MLAAIGDLLNAFVAAIVFPALFAPLASVFFPDRPAWQAAAFALLTTGVAMAGYAFAALAVDLSPRAPSAGVGLVFALTVAAGCALIARSGGATLSAHLARALRPPVEMLSRVAFVAVFAMAFAQFAVVVLRYVFGLNFISLQESVTYFHGTAFLLAAGYALLTGDHVRVDILYCRLSAKRRALIDLAGTYVFLFPFCLLILWAAGPYVANAWAVREGSTEQSGVQGIYLLKTLIPIFAISLAAAGVVVAEGAARRLRGEADA